MIKDEEKKIEYWYDQIPDGAGFRFRGNGRFTEYTPSRSKIIEAKTRPPEGRARLRGALIERAHEIKVDNNLSEEVFLMDWEKFGKRVPTYERCKTIDLPLKKYNDEEIEELVYEFFSK